MGILKKIGISLGIVNAPLEIDYITGYDEFDYCPNCMWTPEIPLTIFCSRGKRTVCNKCGTRLEHGIGRAHYVAIDEINSPYSVPKWISSQFLPKGTGTDNKSNDKQG